MPPRKKKSIFDPRHSVEDIDTRIVALLERFDQVFRRILRDEAQKHALSPIQIQFLIFLRYHRDRLARVSQLARDFRLTQATVSDAVSSLEKKGHLSRIRVKGVGRAAILKLTPRGRRLAEKLSTCANPLVEALEGFSEREKQNASRFLTRFIVHLNEAGVIEDLRICTTCFNFVPNAYPGRANPHQCRLTGRPISNSTLLIDCPHFKRARGSRRAGPA